MIFLCNVPKDRKSKFCSSLCKFGPKCFSKLTVHELKIIWVNICQVLKSCYRKHGHIEDGALCPPSLCVNSRSLRQDFWNWSYKPIVKTLQVLFIPLISDHQSLNVEKFHTTFMCLYQCCSVCLILESVSAANTNAWQKKQLRWQISQAASTCYPKDVWV